MLDVQTIITDALLKVGAMSPQDAGSPDPELQAIAVRELNMLLLDIGLNFSINPSQRTYSFVPQNGDRITFGNIANKILSATYTYQVPSASPYQIQLPSANIQDATVTYIDSDQALTVDWQVAPSATGAVEINPSTGLMMLHSGDAGKWVTVSYRWRASGSDHADVAETPARIISLNFELGNVVYPLREITYAEYQSLSLKRNIQSIPLYYAFDYQFPNPTLWIYPMEIPSMTARLVFSRYFLNAEDGSELDVPDYLYKYLVYNLATQLYTTFPTAAGIDPELVYHAKESASRVRNYITRISVGKARGDFKRRRSARTLWTDLGSPLGGYAQG